MQVEEKKKSTYVLRSGSLGRACGRGNVDEGGGGGYVALRKRECE